MHGTPAGFPFGMPGIGPVMEGAVQQAPQFFLQSTCSLILKLPPQTIHAFTNNFYPNLRVDGTALCDRDHASQKSQLFISSEIFMMKL